MLIAGFGQMKSDCGADHVFSLLPAIDIIDFKAATIFQFFDADVDVILMVTGTQELAME